MSKNFFSCFLGGGGGGARQTVLDSLPRGGEDNQGGGQDIPGYLAPPRGSSRPGGGGAR